MSQRKKARTTEKAVVPAADEGLGGLYDFLPPPDPVNDAAAKEAALASKFTRPPLPPQDKTRVIFLDVDGVLLPSGSVDTIMIEGVALPVRNVKESDFSAQAMGSLRAIVEQTGATIVLSSEWRRTEELRSSMSAVIRSNDIPSFRDFTPIFKPRAEVQQINGVFAWCERRAREIGAWLKDHPEVIGWVALDDLDFAWADNFRQTGTPWMKIRSVHTDPKICLTEGDVQLATEILLNPPPEPRMRKVQRSREEAPSGGMLCSTEDSAPERIRLG